MFQWVAFYTDGTVFPQFHPETGKEHLYGEVEHDRLCKFGLYPFHPEFAEKVTAAGTAVLAIPLPHYEVHLGRGDYLTFFRKNFVETKFSMAGEGAEVNRREIIYALGVHKIRGRKRRYDAHRIMYIREDGSVELSSQRLGFGKAAWSK